MYNKIYYYSPKNDTNQYKCIILYEKDVLPEEIIKTQKKIERGVNYKI